MLDFSQISELSLHAEVASDLFHVLDQLDVRAIVVGAFARDLHLHHGAGVPIQRGTADIDFALAVSGWPEFEQLRAALLEKDAFQKIEGKQHRLRHKNNIKLDLVPFGEIETRERTIEWPPNGAFVMDVFGFQEALTSSILIVLPGNVRIPIVSLAGLSLLKIIAWDDRHLRAPRKDASDLNLILRNYLAVSANQQRLFEEFTAWMDAEDFDYELGGARMVGNDIRALLDDAGNAKVAAIVSTQVADEIPGELPQEMNRHDPQAALKLLRALQQGLNHD